MNQVRIAAIILINFLFQSTLLNLFSVSGVVPNTSLIIVISISIIAGKNIGASAGFAAGLIQDIAFSEIIGINALIFLFLGLIFGNLEQKIDKENALIPLAASVIGTIIFYMLQISSLYLLQQDIIAGEIWLSGLLKEIFYNGIVSVFIYRALMKNIIKPHMKLANRY